MDQDAMFLPPLCGHVIKCRTDIRISCDVYCRSALSLLTNVGNFIGLDWHMLHVAVQIDADFRIVTRREAYFASEHHKSLQCDLLKRKQYAVDLRTKVLAKLVIVRKYLVSIKAFYQNSQAKGHARNNTVLHMANFHDDAYLVLQMCHPLDV